MSKQALENFERALHHQFILPILRSNDPALCLKFAQCLYKQGFEILEITLTTPQALAQIAQLAFEGVHVGAGTVLDTDQAKAAIASGARFLISPGLSFKIADLAQSADVPYFPGVYSPTEVMQALNHGLTRMKLFPASTGGIDYFKHLQGPFPQVRFLPTGGLNFAQLKDWHNAGVLAVGQGTRLVSEQALAAQDWPQIETQLQAIREEVARWHSP
jgi:2-dehydro-3-deoxyphosphogluconate aldolase / (4S)-4-hydroxy-2-oxoglutarate aldolase